MLTSENPIDYYMLIEGSQYIRFEAEDIIHGKYVNPNFDMQVSRMYKRLAHGRNEAAAASDPKWSRQ